MMKDAAENIIGYLEKRLSPEQTELFEQAMNESPDFKKEVEDIAFIWKISGELKLHHSINPADNWEKLSSKIRKDKLKIAFTKFFRSAAAILLLPVLIVTGILYGKLNKLNNEPAEQLKVTAAAGTVSTITLPDSTEVYLNSGSTLSYPARFKKGERVVSLSGEAYFKVSSDKSNRFDVLLPDSIIVSAYGTEFNICTYEAEEKVKITLVSGNIEVGKIGLPEKQAVAPGEILSYNKTDNKFTLSDANMLVETGWKDGKMAFRRTCMTDVIAELSRHFNVKIILEDKELYDYEYSATFTAETLPEILELLAKTAPIEYEIKELAQSVDYSFPQRTIVMKIKK